MFWRMSKGRSDVVAKNGIVATSQPLASQAGIKMLEMGGNAVDAAIAAAAVLDVVEPFSTGCGGDAFALIHIPGKRAPLSFNGSGRSGSLISIEELQGRGWNEMPLRGGAPVTVPGAMHLWVELVEKYGSLELSNVLGPAIQYAKEGFPVSPIISQVWSRLVDVLQNDAARSLYTLNGRAPEIGELMKNPGLSNVFESVSSEGANAFYTGEIGNAIVETVQEHGGFLTVDDLANHQTMLTEAISTSYRGTHVFEHPPNGQGFAALIMLNVMENYDFTKYLPMSADRYHLMIEAKKLAYSDLYSHNADPDYFRVPMEKLLDKEYGKKRSELIKMSSASKSVQTGFPLGEDTIYLCTADGDGLAVSFINSLYMGFGSGIVVPKYGIKLQNRGNLFTLDSSHPNCYASRKLPFHTIIPGALYRDSDLYGVFGIMGGAHQAQAHAQFVSNLVDYGMSPQEALDYPRFHHNQKSNTIGLENAIPAFVQRELRRRKHNLDHKTQTTFGGGQAILNLNESWIAGSDFRKDGQAVGF